MSFSKSLPHHANGECRNCGNSCGIPAAFCNLLPMTAVDVLSTSGPRAGRVAVEPDSRGAILSKGEQNNTQGRKDVAKEEELSKRLEVMGV